MSAEESTHWEGCWRVHDDCALAEAKTLLEGDESIPYRYATLIHIQVGIDGHANGPCPAPRDQCSFAVLARRVLDEANVRAARS